MKIARYGWVFGYFLVLSGSPAFAGEDATSLVRRSEAHVRGTSFQGEVEMTVDHDGSSRSLAMKVWTEGQDKAMVKITKPPKDRDTGNLRLKLELWQYLPNVDRIVKIPSSMMLQSWMGSDFTNDDLVRTSSLTRDYDHRIEGHEKIAGFPAVRIACTPHKNAPVVWGKVVVWVREKDAVPLRQDYFTENGERIKSLEGSEILSFGSHTLPTVVVMTHLKKKNSKTTLKYSNLVFDQPIETSIFTQEFLRRASHH